MVFHLHNFGHREPKVSDSNKDRRAFVDVSAVIFPSEYSRRHHARMLGLDGPVIPDPIPLDRIFAADPEPKYVTFINPQPCEGTAVLARIATAVFRGRPGLPLLIGLIPQVNAAFDLENRKTDLTPRSPPVFKANCLPDPEFYSKRQSTPGIRTRCKVCLLRWIQAPPSYATSPATQLSPPRNRRRLHGCESTVNVPRGTLWSNRLFQVRTTSPPTSRFSDR